MCMSLSAFKSTIGINAVFALAPECLRNPTAALPPRAGKPLATPSTCASDFQDSDDYSF